MKTTSQKALIPALFMLFVLPLALLLYIEIREINRWIDFNRKERIGVEYNRSLRNILENLMSHRGMTSAHLSGNPSFYSRLAKERSLIDKNIRTIDLLNDKYGALLDTDNKWNEFKKKWIALKDKQPALSPKDNFDSHTALITDIIALTSHIGETSNLLLDPQITTYYLMDCVTFKLPVLLENLGQARGIGVKVAATHQMSNGEKRQLMMLSTLIRLSLDEANERIQKVFSSNPELRPELEPYAEQLNRDVKDFLNTFEREIINADEIAINPTVYYDTATKVIDAGFRVYDKQSPALDKLLKARIDSDISEKYLFLAISTVLTGIFVYVITILNRNIASLEIADKSLRHQVEFEKIVASISTTFINTSASGMDDSISRVLQKIRVFVGADTCYISLFSNNALTIDCLDEWCAEGIQPQKEHYTGLSVDKMPWAVDKLKKLEIINIPRVDDLPSGARAEKALLQATGVNSVLIIPLVFNGKTIGLLGLNSIRTERNWTENDILLLKIVGEILANALERRKMQQFLKDSREYVQMILNSQEGILIITDGKKLSFANKSFLDFFGYEYLEEFFQEHNCICDMFVNEIGFISKEEDKCPELMFSRANEQYKVKLFDKKTGQNRVFLANPKKLPGEREQSIVSFSDITDIENESKRLEYLSITDPLTKIYNRLKFDSVLDFQIAMARRYQKFFSVIMFDIDHFKEINDTLGHKVGDETLKKLVQIISGSLRASDIFARWGGEEFMVLLPETELDGAVSLAEDLRKQVESADFDVAGYVTCSFGAISYNIDDNADTLIRRVDDALYEAKKGGRNRVCMK